VGRKKDELGAFHTPVDLIEDMGVSDGIPDFPLYDLGKHLLETGGIPSGAFFNSKKGTLTHGI